MWGRQSTRYRCCECTRPLHPYVVAQPTHLLYIADFAWRQNIAHYGALESVRACQNTEFDYLTDGGRACDKDGCSAPS